MAFFMDGKNRFLYDNYEEHENLKHDSIMENKIAKELNESTASDMVAINKERESNKIQRHNSIIEDRIAEENMRADSMQKADKIEDNAIIGNLASVYLNAIPLDESFVDMHAERLIGYFQESVKDKADVLVENIRKSKNPACKKIVNEAKEESSKAIDKINDGDFDVEKQEADTVLDIKNKDLNVDEKEVADIVKNKVLETIEVEEEESKKEAEMVKDILESRAAGNNTELTESTHDQAQHSMFKSIVIGKYTNTIDATTKDGVVPGLSTLNESNEISVNMDNILAEAVIEYTRLELFNTLGIMEKRDHRELRKMANNIALGDSYPM